MEEVRGKREEEGEGEAEEEMIRQHFNHQRKRSILFLISLKKGEAKLCFAAPEEEEAVEEKEVKAEVEDKEEDVEQVEMTVMLMTKSRIQRLLLLS